MTLRGRPQLLDPASRPTQTAGTSVTAAAPPPLHAEALRALVDEPCHASTATPPASGPPSRPSFVGGIPSAGLAALAVPLRRADSAYEDEVRYVDVSAEASVSVDVCDLEVMEIGSIADLQADALLTEALEAERLVHLSATKLFVDVPHAALVELARVSELLALRTGQSVVRKGEPADALFVIV
ncbi:MAG: hypothetical protein MUF54_13955, partial [Polyangiaceae bacterium]|nr:hypothetical protein [Polyangiaceae bacterium]